MGKGGKLWRGRERGGRKRADLKGHGRRVGREWDTVLSARSLTPPHLIHPLLVIIHLLAADSFCYWPSIISQQSARIE